jgi:hypothetical protein
MVWEKVNITGNEKNDKELVYRDRILASKYFPLRYQKLIKRYGIIKLYELPTLLGKNLKANLAVRLISMKDCQDIRYEENLLSTSIWNKNIKF